MRFDGFLHLDLFSVPLLLVEFGAEATQILRILARRFGLTGMPFADSFFMVESGRMVLEERGQKGEVVVGKATFCHAASASAQYIRFEAVRELSATSCPVREQVVRASPWLQTVCDLVQDNERDTRTCALTPISKSWRERIFFHTPRLSFDPFLGMKHSEGGLCQGIPSQEYRHKI